jgi:hypothetical protein
VTEHPRDVADRLARALIEGLCNHKVPAIGLADITRAVDTLAPHEPPEYRELLIDLTTRRVVEIAA